MACYAFTPAMGFIDDRLQLFDGESRLRYEIAFVIHPGAMRHVDLDPVRTIVELLARGFARLNWAIDQLCPFWNCDLGSVALERIAASAGNCASGDKHARTGNVAGVDCFLDPDIAVTRALGF